MSTPLGAQPQPPMFEAGRFTTPWGGWFSIAHLILIAASTSGTTAQRPTKNQWVGKPYFDTTLGKPIWLLTIGPPAVWVDATGTPV